MFAGLFNVPGVWFTAAGLLGTGVFVIRLVMALLGGHGGHGFHDVGGHDFGHAGAGHDASGHGQDGKNQSTQTFELLSLQSVAGFLMGFGWGGIAALKSLHWGVLGSIGAGVACGGFMVYLIAVTFRAIYSLGASGNIDMWEAVGVEGEVYANVPLAGEGMGKVKMVVSSRQRVVNAVAIDEALSTKTRVRVLKVNADNTVTVARV